MSAIAKTLTTAFLAAALMGPVTANAQDMKADFFTDLTSAKKTNAAQKEDLLSTIEKMIENVANMEVDSSSNTTITIEEIDRRNREAQRLQNDLVLRELKFKEMQAKVDMLVLLEKTRKELAEQDNGASQTPDPIALQIQAAADQQEREAEQQAKAQERAAQTAQHEQMSIPRVVLIAGGGGRFSAEIESVQGVRQTAKKGSNLINGFQVVDIAVDGVTLKGLNTGATYFVVPSPPPPPPSDNEGGSAQQAIDMSRPNPMMPGF